MIRTALVVILSFACYFLATQLTEMRRLADELSRQHTLWYCKTTVCADPAPKPAFLQETDWTTFTRALQGPNGYERVLLEGAKMGF